jgi:hypothetical protein
MSPQTTVTIDRPVSEIEGEPDEPVAVTQVDAAAAEFRQLFPDEFSQVFGNRVPASMADLDPFYRALTSRRQPTALCLSGGGVRSATFSLGVLQALAGKGWLERFDYLSTVSGGGFIGGFLSRWRAQDADWTEARMAEEPEIFGFDRSAMHPVRRLRSYSNYLTPRTGMSGDGLIFISDAVGKFAFNFLPWALPLLGLAAVLRAAAIMLGIGAEWLAKSHTWLPANPNWWSPTMPALPSSSWR